MNFMGILLASTSDDHRFSEPSPKSIVIGLEIELSLSSGGIGWTPAAQIILFLAMLHAEHVSRAIGAL